MEMQVSTETSTTETSTQTFNEKITCLWLLTSNMKPSSLAIAWSIFVDTVLAIIYTDEPVDT